MPIQKPYRMRATESGITNFNYTDILNLIGYVNYYGIRLTNGATTFDETFVNAVMTGASLYDSLNTSPDPTVASFTLNINSARNISGKFFANFTWGWRGNSSTTCCINMAVYKNSTQLASMRGADLTGAGAQRNESLELVIPQTRFNKGDNFIVKFWYTLLGAAYIQGGPLIFCDPYNVDNTPQYFSTFTKTKMLIGVPFKIDL